MSAGPYLVETLLAECAPLNQRGKPRARKDVALAVQRYLLFAILAGPSRDIPARCRPPAPIFLTHAGSFPVVHRSLTAVAVACNRYYINARQLRVQLAPMIGFG